jgi:predicted HTH transcriptional regulator
MIPKDIDAIAKEDIDKLITEKVTEQKTLEYKQELPKPSDKEIKEFLADISSFANASGGDIIYGIKPAVDPVSGKKTGAPDSVMPIQNETSDAAILRLENIIRDGIAPRVRAPIRGITGCGNGTGFVLLIRIPKSFASPHMVKFQDTSRFFSRNSAGKYQLDVGEIRSAFALSESIPERIRRFRQDRIGNIIARETPGTLIPNVAVHVVHIIPLQSPLCITIRSPPFLDGSHS